MIKVALSYFLKDFPQALAKISNPLRHWELPTYTKLNSSGFINGCKSVGIHCEADFIQTTSGRDEDDAPDFYNEFSSFYDPTVPQVTSKIDRFNGTDDLRG